MKFISSLFLSLALLFQFNLYAQVLPEIVTGCKINFVVLNQQPLRSLEEIKNLKIMTYNVLNLMESKGRYEVNPKTGFKEFVPSPTDKPIKQTLAIADMIDEQNPDILIMQEVENYAALEQFNLNFLEQKYQSFLVDGNDTRGIDIGILIKRDLPFSIEFQTHKNISYINESGQTELVFSRDLPAMLIYTKKKAENENIPPTFIVLGTHYKSQRSSNTDQGGLKKRTAQVMVTAKIIQHYQTLYPNVPVILGGDFNGDLLTHPEFAALFENNLMLDALSLNNPPLTTLERTTHTYHPNNGQAEYGQLDGLLVTTNLKNALLRSYVPRYKGKNGQILPLPTTYKERERQPSDHFPIVMELNFPTLLNINP